MAVDAVKMGKTPCVLPVPRRGWNKTITFTKPGYKTVNYTLKNSLDGALAGNIIFFPGIIVDVISGRGGGYADSVTVLLEPGSGSIEMDAKDKAKRRP